MDYNSLRNCEEDQETECIRDDPRSLTLKLKKKTCGV